MIEMKRRSGSRPETTGRPAGSILLGVRSLAAVLAFLLLWTANLSALQVDPAGATVWTLDAVLDRAIESNRELREANLGFREAEGLVTEAWSAVYPRIDLSGSYTRNLSPPASFFPAIFFDPDAEGDELVRVVFGADNVWSTTVSLEQPIFEARAFIGVGAAARFRALQDESVRGTAHRVLTRVRVLYFDLLLAQEQAGLLERSVERVLESLEETRSLQRAGLASEFDVLRLEVELANLEPQLRRALNQAQAQERALRTELDLESDVAMRVAGSLAEMELHDLERNEGENRAILARFGSDSPDPGDLDAVSQLRTRALERSSTIRQLDLDEELKLAELRVEQAEYLPRVSLFGNYQIQAQQDGSPEFFASSGLRGYGRVVGIQVTMPIFTGRQRGARVQQKSAALESARVQRDRVGDELADELQTLVELVDEARLRARGQRLAVEQAERGYQIAAAQFREGVGSRLELTDAEIALRQSEFNYAEAVHDYLSARARLDELTGEVPIP